MLLLAPLVVHCRAQSNVSPPLIPQGIRSHVSVAVPSKLQKVDTGPVTPGSRATTEVWLAHTKLGTVQVSVFSDNSPTPLNPGGSLTEILDALLDKKADVTSDEDIVVQGWPGVAIRAKMRDGSQLAIRAVCCDHFVVSVGYALTGGSWPPEVNQILGSLKLDSKGSTEKPAVPLFRYALGKSGDSALFPQKPDMEVNRSGSKPSRHDQFAFSARYGFRTFVESYKDLSESQAKSDAEYQQTLLQVTQGTLSTLQGTIKKREPYVLGGDKALRTEFTNPYHERGTILVLLHRRRLVILLALAPQSYPANGFEPFFHSIQFGHP